MNRRWRYAAAALLTALVLTTPALGVNVIANGTTLTASQAWVENGTSYMTLRTFAALTGYKLSWDWKSGQAALTGRNLDLAARPGAIYITVNGRALYVEGGVKVVDGQMALPLRVLADATGASLSWDGATGAAVLSTRGAKPPQADYDADALYWLSRIISAESKGEPLLGQIAVGNVVLNRVADSAFPNTIYGVIFDRQYGYYQFQPVADGTIHSEPTQQAVLAAKMVLEGARVVGDSKYFFAPALSSGSWIVSNRTYYTTIGNHRFYL